MFVVSWDTYLGDTTYPSRPLTPHPPGWSRIISRSRTTSAPAHTQFCLQETKTNTMQSERELFAARRGSTRGSGRLVSLCAYYGPPRTCCSSESGTYAMGTFGMRPLRKPSFAVLPTPGTACVMTGSGVSFLFACDREVLVIS